MTTAATDRITQFEKMAREDPTNDMAHFSLGNAYLQAGRAAEAAKAFENAVAVNPGMSKAYQLGGEAMIKAGWADKAEAILKKGYEVAATRGDRMPQQAIVELLTSIGREPPQVVAAPSGADHLKTSGAFVCRRTGRPGIKLPRAPIPRTPWTMDFREHFGGDLANLDRTGHESHQRIAAGSFSRSGPGRV